MLYGSGFALHGLVALVQRASAFPALGVVVIPSLEVMDAVRWCLWLHGLAALILSMHSREQLLSLCSGMKSGWTIIRYRFPLAWQLFCGSKRHCTPQSLV